MYLYNKNVLAEINLYEDMRTQWDQNAHTDIPRLRLGKVGAQVGCLI